MLSEAVCGISPEGLVLHPNQQDFRPNVFFYHCLKVRFFAFIVVLNLKKAFSRIIIISSREKTGL